MPTGSASFVLFSSCRLDLKKVGSQHLGPLVHPSAALILPPPKVLKCAEAKSLGGVV